MGRLVFLGWMGSSRLIPISILIPDFLISCYLSVSILIMA